MKKINWALLLFLTTMLFACNADDVTAETETETTTKNTQKRLNGQIPFTVENVQNALPVVLAYYHEHKPEVAQRFAGYQVTPTHIYYKFTPTDSAQYSLLRAQDGILNLTTDRFEYEREERTEDPSDTEIPVFYAIVAADQQLPEVPHQVIAPLHFTNEDDLEDAEENYDEIEFKQNLMYQARKQAGHLDEEEIAEGFMDIWTDEPQSGTAAKGLLPKKWRPSGTVQVEDDHLTNMNGGNKIYLPVVNCEVNVLKWGFLRVENGGTNDFGYFSTGTTYTKHVHYNVKFTDFNKVVIKSGNFHDIANYKSDSHKKRALDAKFQRNTKMQFYALVNNAAWYYFNTVVVVSGLNSPNTVEISAHWSGNDKSNYYFDAVPFRSEIKISRNKNGVYRGSDGVFASVIHEMTHKGHYRMDNGAFGIFGGKSLLFLRESWASCVEYSVTNSRYNMLFHVYNFGPYIASNLINSSYSIRTWGGERQFRTVAQQDEYSEAFIDLMDIYNQSSWSSTLPNERVRAYTLSQIQGALNNSRTVNDFFDKLRANYNNTTENDLIPIQNYANDIVSSL